MATAIRTLLVFAMPMCGMANLDAATPSPKRVAVCIAGEERSFSMQPVWANIFATMVEPIREQADVFFALSKNGAAPRFKAAFPKASTAELERIMMDRFDAVNITWRKGGNVHRQPRTWVHDLVQNPSDANAGLNGSAYGAKMVAAALAHVPCWQMVTERERSLARGGRPYDWVLRLRGDVVYKNKLPSFAAWPRPVDPPLIPESGIVFVECCGTCGHKNKRELAAKLCLPGTHGKEKLGCAKDTWGLMSRAAADVYFDGGLLANPSARTKAQNKTCSNHSAECRLGCALHLHGVRLRLGASIARTIIRHKSEGHKVKKTEKLGLIRLDP